MKYEFTQDTIVLSPLLSKVTFRKEDITDVSVPIEEYAPSNGILVGAIHDGMDTVMLHTRKGNFYFYTSTAQRFIKKLENFLAS